MLFVPSSGSSIRPRLLDFVIALAVDTLTHTTRSIGLSGVGMAV